MSRIGRKPIKVPEKVKVALDGRVLSVEGPLGKLTALVPEGTALRQEGGVIGIGEPSAQRSNKGFQGLVRALLANMVHGVVHGYERNLEITGVGYKATLEGSELVVAAGYSHLVRLRVPTGIKVGLDKSQTKVSVKGNDKQVVGQFAAKVRAVKKPEPYKGKGIKYSYETPRRKAGKAGAK